MAGLTQADPESARIVRLEHAQPRYGEDIFDTTLPQETRQMHALHYLCRDHGGLPSDGTRDAETTLDGLYACGEIAGGTHGRNRMMGNSLLECCVFGRRAGKAAAEAARA